MVVAVAGAWKGAPRHLKRSISVGGALRPLLWALAYDPILVALRAATLARAPTYVEDLSTLARGARRTVWILLVPAGSRARSGPSHGNAWVRSPAGGPRLLVVRRLLAAFPLRGSGGPS
eukprot:995176-Alexandrium_andersonii.AAC.2